MACSKYEYVKFYENQEGLLPNCFIVVRIDGKGFHKFTDMHKFEKPNDKRGMDLMNKAAQATMEMFQDIFIAYGQSDEYSFVLDRNTKLFKRRGDKIHSTIVSCFTSNYVFYFSQFFPDQPLLQAPVFDSRCVMYPTEKNLRDYMSWRQVDCHINNLYNTCFWYMVEKKGVSKQEANDVLQQTDAAQKNELLFNDFNTNYNDLPEQFKKGNILIREKVPVVKETKQQQQKQENNEEGEEILQQQQEKLEKLNLDKDQQQEKDQKTEKKLKVKEKMKSVISILFVDIIKDDFWKKNEKSLKVKLY